MKVIKYIILYGSGSTYQKVTVPTVLVPQRWIFPHCLSIRMTDLMCVLVSVLAYEEEEDLQPVGVQMLGPLPLV
jgi:hypothetical protein